MNSNSQGMLDLDLGKFVLPDLVLGPIRYPIGTATKLLRNGSTEQITAIDDVLISARTKAQRVTLSNGERVILTEKTKISVPTNVDGVVRKMPDGSRKWIFHKALKRLEDKIAADGLGQVSEAGIQSWAGRFTYKAEGQGEDDFGLRPPQLGALFSVGAHWSLSSQTATVVMPTGTGKTETMLAVLTAHQLEKVIIAVPGKALRSQTSDKFIELGLLRFLNVIENGVENPVVGTITKRPKSKDDLQIFKDCNVIIGTVSSLSGDKTNNFASEIAKIADVLIVDEAHHVTAGTWTTLREAFATKKVLQFTATPFRSDGKLVDGTVIYSYPLKSAQDDGYFKPITFEPIHEMDTDKADKAIAEKAIEQLRSDISAGYNHLIMARCNSIARATEVLEIYEAIGAEFNPVIIHSELNDSEERIKRIKSGDSKIAICVNMLGEGFDLPELKIAAIHDLHKSLAILLQFIGRFTRTSGENLGDATVVANIADTGVSDALERLYSEDSDWNELLSEMSSDAAKEHSELVKFLSNSISLDEVEDEIPGILFVLHYDSTSKLLCLASSFKGSNFVDMATAVGATEQVSGETVFRSLGKIGRLVFNNLGVSKHGRRNLSYAMYTGSDVKRALGEAEKSGSRKSNLTGHGWENGAQITIGCSYKGRVWSRDVGTIPKFIRWAENVGAKLVDSTIDTKDIIDNVLIPEEATAVPDTRILGMEWPIELLNKSEDSMSVVTGSNSYPLFLLDLAHTSVDLSKNEVSFSLYANGNDQSVGDFILNVGGINGFTVTQVSKPEAILKIGLSTEVLLAEFFSNYPPLIRFIDLSELDGNLILRPTNPIDLTLANERLEAWDWSNVDITKESIWKDGAAREDSIQWAVAEKYKAGGYSVVFDDDGAGEAADLVCFKEETDHIKLALIHCKFSGSGSAGKRVKDVVEVSSQAIRSAKWPGRFKRLIRHLKSRNTNKVRSQGRNLFLHGASSDLIRLGKAERFKEVRPEIIIVQPGLSQKNMTDDQKIVLAAAVDYLKQTLGIDLDVICSD